MAASIDATKTAIFAASKSAATENASLAMKSDIVNPIPASAPAPATCSYEEIWRLTATFSQTASAENNMIPSGLPIVSRLTRRESFP